ncbi:hypothetical protein ACQP2F_25735 [Actinoplanes sp. CA-030573]|uniref:hypothetical protein n=1 Tax=Actinoplanes sp. CA-030573 TaxID=3239898 RepID=UPI003D8E0C80
MDIASLYDLARAGDLVSFQLAMPDLGVAAAEGGPETLGELAGLFDLVPAAMAGHLAIIAGALVENGAPPGPVVAPIARGLLEVLTAASGFAGTWRAMVGGKERPPNPGGAQDAYDGSIARLTRGRRLPRRAGLPHDRAVEYANGWFPLEEWATAATSVLTDRAARAAFPRRDEALRLVRELSQVRGDLGRLEDVLAVLDDEQLLVVDRAEGRAWTVRIGGIAENFQLYTMLADAFGRDVDPAWLAASTTGPAGKAGRIEARVQLSDAHGRYIAVEGRPADIPVVEDRRVVVLDPPPYGRSWDLGRAHDRMVPWLEVAEAHDGVPVTVAPAERIPGHRPANIHFGRLAGTVEVTG